MSMHGTNRAGEHAPLATHSSIRAHLDADLFSFMASSSSSFRQGVWSSVVLRQAHANGTRLSASRMPAVDHAEVQGEEDRSPEHLSE
jgi:hypothetical protein